MTNDSFEKMDSHWMHEFQSVREKGVPQGILKGFAASVERRIELERPEQGASKTFRRRFFMPVFVPTFAVLVISAAIVTRLPLWAPSPEVATPSVELAQAPNAEELSTEIAALREIGVWTEEDEAALGVSTEHVLSEIELYN